MASGRAGFEIQILRNNHWITDEYRETESAGRAVAKSILGKHECQGVRVVKSWKRADGVETETVVFTEMAGTVAPNVTIVAIDTAPYCRKTAEYYRLESRSTINRLFRKYIEQVYLTPTELIHNYKALKKIQEVDTLFPAAVDRVATIQARFAGEEPRGRRDEVYRAVAKMTTRARQADEHPGLPRLKGDDFGKILERIERFAAPADVNFYSLVVLSRDLVERRNWLAKLERLVALTNPDRGFARSTCLAGAQRIPSGGVVTGNALIIGYGVRPVFCAGVTAPSEEHFGARLPGCLVQSLRAF